MIKIINKSIKPINKIKYTKQINRSTKPINKTKSTKPINKTKSTKPINKTKSIKPINKTIKPINKNNIYIYFILSSISFLQLYLPIVNLAINNNIKSVFYIRTNMKNYACPIKNKDNVYFLNNFIKKYNIIIKNEKDIINLKTGILFVVDGDIYGPNEENKKESLLFKYNLNKNIKIISLCEHLNFLWAYNKYINKVNYVIFPNIIFQNFYNLKNNKNIFLGNTKFDDICSFDNIYKKHKILSNTKYVLFLYPKKKFIQSYTINSSHINNLFNIFKNIGYKIIVKNRPKDIVFNDCKADYNIISDTYPNETLELMKISELCVFFSSSAIDECVMMEIPAIDFVVDDNFQKRYEFLYNDKIISQITNWKFITHNKLSIIINKLEKKNSIIFKQIKEKFMYLHNNTSKKILDYFIK